MKVFFCPAMVVDAQSYSPSAAKPGLAVASWQQRAGPWTWWRPRR